MRRFTPVLLLLGVYGLAACSAGDTLKGPGLDPDEVLEARRVSDEVRPAVESVVEAGNAFAFDLYRQLSGATDGNLFLSPFSVSTAFAMTWAGARGATAEEMADVLHLTDPAMEVHAGFDALIHSLNAGTGLGGYELTVANRLWGQSGFDFREPYLELTRERYHAGLQSTDFRSDPETSRGAINAWVEDRTKGRIEDLLPPGSVTPDTRLVLTNAIYFKGRWRNTFDPEQTRNLPFRVGPENEKSVPMMFQGGLWKSGSAGKTQLLELPYAGLDLGMLVLLPAEEEGLAALERELDAGRLAGWRQGMAERKLDVYLPRFGITSDFSLRESMTALGMPTAFTDRADFTGIAPGGGLAISDALHKAFVKVNEEGTEAAAATGVVVGVTSVTPSFRADHPFLFLILDNVTGSILFVGRVVDPTLGS